MFTAVTELSTDDLIAIANNREISLINFFHAVIPQKDGTSRLMYYGSDPKLQDEFNWEIGALTPSFDAMRFYYTHENNHLTTITIWVRMYGGWGWNDPDMWGDMSPVTVNDMSGFMSGSELHIIHAENNITYAIVSSSRAAANEATLIRIAESLR